MKANNIRVLIIGCGYLGNSLARRLKSEGHRVFALRRNAGAAADFQLNGIIPLQGDITLPADLAKIKPEFDAVVNLVSSSKGGEEDYRKVYLEGTQNILRWLNHARPRTFLYTSSTSVYAQSDGSWVEESSAADPESETSKVLVETERELLKAHQEFGFPAVILRASGIYGPGRGHLFKQFLRGEATMRGDGSPWINMIHVEDLARAIMHLIEHGRAGEIYNASDEEPVTQFEFFQWLAERLGKGMPPGAPPEAGRKRGLTNKRVSNRKLRMTGFTFQYPTFREGYGAEIERGHNAE